MNTAILQDLIECIACGLTVSETRLAVPAADEQHMAEAIAEAIKCGVEWEDVAPSWRAYA